MRLYSRTWCCPCVPNSGQEYSLAHTASRTATIARSSERVSQSIAATCRATGRKHGAPCVAVTAHSARAGRRQKGKRV
ncbi:hypothetical protein BD413DRAFT_29522 [Trametes elegans]|nr:hypothetical protein BD413DRAFT_29522 [Trametes elegans]